MKFEIDGGHGFISFDGNEKYNYAVDDLLLQGEVNGNSDEIYLLPISVHHLIYLLIAAGFLALAWLLGSIFIFLAIIPLPFAFFLLVLALPLRKDQPMETYLAALVSYYLKPRTRRWTPGQRESTILITAPKIAEETRTRDLSEEEATHRLSFLADIVDTGGYAIKGASNTSMRDELVAEANATEDMFDSYDNMNFDRVMRSEQTERKEEAIKNMRDAIERSEDLSMQSATITNDRGLGHETTNDTMPTQSAESVVVMPDSNIAQNVSTKPVSHSIMELANNSDFSVATIAKEANRINGKEKGEVFISLH